MTMAEVIEYLYNRPCCGRVVIDDAVKKAIDEYYERIWRGGICRKRLL